MTVTFFMHCMYFLSVYTLGRILQTVKDTVALIARRYRLLILWLIAYPVYCLLPILEAVAHRWSLFLHCGGTPKKNWKAQESYDATRTVENVGYQFSWHWWWKLENWSGEYFMYICTVVSDGYHTTLMNAGHWKMCPTEWLRSACPSYIVEDSSADERQQWVHCSFSITTQNNSNVPWWCSCWLLWAPGTD